MTQIERDSGVVPFRGKGRSSLLDALRQWRRFVALALPRRLAADLKRRRDRHIAPRFHEDWTRAIQRVRPQPVAPLVDRLLLIVPDPVHLSGSLGDDAMITACVQYARSVNAGIEIHVLVDGVVAEGKAAALGLRADRVKGSDYLSGFADYLNERSFGVAVAVGADIMDGHYGFKGAAMMAALCDIAVRAGVRASILGFSFNQAPSPELGAVFNRTHRDVTFNLRDIHSLQRFSAITSAPARLVADAAFCLRGEPGRTDGLSWIARQRQDGRKVVGVNIHPMLIKDATRQQLVDLVAGLNEALVAVAGHRRVAYLIVSHDYRKRVGDVDLLRSVYATAEPMLGDRIHLLAGQYSAAELKGLVGSLDGVITGRMHLAVGALGSGVPALCITYQDKFEGLFAHFDLPAWLLISPDALMKRSHLEGKLLRFVDELEELHAAIAAKLPHVRELSQANFTALLPG